MTRTGSGWAFVVALGLCPVDARQKPVFEVISVKRQLEAVSFGNMASAGPRVRPGGVFSASHATVTALILFAYDLKPFQISGAPDWAQRELFDVSARAGGDASTAQVKLMVRSLLEDRFSLVVHTERREMRFLGLVVARPDGRLGPYLRRMGEECTAASAGEVKKTFPPRAATTEDGMISGSCGDMSGLASLLTFQVDLPIVDQTGLEGKFVYSVLGVSLRSPGRIAAADASPWPSVPEALEEQLGLRLVERRGPLEGLVVDSVQRPTEN